MGLAFDFRGCGESDGRYEDQTQRMGMEDAIVGLEFLLKQNIDKKRIGIQGTSWGGYLAGILLNDPKFQFIKSVVLRVPAAYSDSFLDTTIRASDKKDFFLNKENWANASSYNGLAKFKGDLLVIRSEKDELILAEAVNKYYEVAAQVRRRELYVHKNAGHSLSDNPKGLKEFQEIVVNWFSETL
jgi:dipeptidyl aminopeptidase/acylaminoacyl peptidase